MTPAAFPAGPQQPGRDCPLCPRLAAFRQANRSRFTGYHNAPVPSFGDTDVRLLVVGLAPGLHGANASGRPFTGDYAGDLLYAMLLKHGFARGTYGARADDGLHLVDCRITNAVRCVPPENKPVGAEVGACRDFLAAEIRALPHLTVILALGQVAHRAVLAVCRVPAARVPFAHAGLHIPTGQWHLLASYHCSRYNTNTGRLTPAMFDAVVGRARALVDGARASAPLA